MSREEIPVFNDHDIERAVTMKEAISVMREALIQKHNGRITDLQRSRLEMGNTALVWTPGGFPDDMILGLRLYLAGLRDSEQLVSVWETETGKIKCLNVGSLLGVLRTGAIGGAAIDVLSRKDSTTLGIIGLGNQGLMQARAACAVRDIERISVYRRDSHILKNNASALSRELGVDVITADNADDAVKKVDIIVTATNSTVPVLRKELIEPGTHINSLGLKFHGRTELDPAIPDMAGIVCSDFPENLRTDEDVILRESIRKKELRDLSELVSKGYARNENEISLFLSHGLPGTEVKMLDHIFKKLKNVV